MDHEEQTDMEGREVLEAEVDQATHGLPILMSITLITMDIASQELALIITLTLEVLMVPLGLLDTVETHRSTAVTMGLMAPSNSLLSIQLVPLNISRSSKFRW